LARALYSQADIYLLDDPLSAVDPQVANKIFNDCIGEHLKDKLVVLVTHQLQYLSKCQKVLVLHDKHQVALTSFSEIQAIEGFNIDQIMNASQKRLQNEEGQGKEAKFTDDELPQ